MNTRSMTKRLYTYTVFIDFDEASNAWKANKKSSGNGCYKYICSQITNSKPCKSESLSGCSFCKIHNKLSI